MKKNNSGLVRQSFSEGGQILVVIPFCVLLMVGAILMTIDVFSMSIERVHIQRVADIAARDGAYVQAQALEALALLNMGLAPCYATMDGQCFCKWVRVPHVCDPWESAHNTAKGIQNSQKAILYGTPALVLFTVKQSASNNGASASILSSSTTSLYLDWTFAISPGFDWAVNFGCYGLDKSGFLLRKDINYVMGSFGSCHIKERVDVEASKEGAPAYGRYLLGKDLAFPTMKARSSARPYYMGTIFTHPAREDDLSGGAPAICENYACMMKGRWDAKIVTYLKK